MHKMFNNGNPLTISVTSRFKQSAGFKCWTLPPVCHKTDGENQRKEWCEMTEVGAPEIYKSTNQPNSQPELLMILTTQCNCEVWQEHLDSWYTMICGISCNYCNQADSIKFNTVNTACYL